MLSNAANHLCKLLQKLLSSSKRSELNYIAHKFIIYNTDYKTFCDNLQINSTLELSPLLKYHVTIEFYISLLKKLIPITVNTTNQQVIPPLDDDEIGALTYVAGYQ